MNIAIVSVPIPPPCPCTRYVESFNPRLGQWAEDAALAEARRGAAKAHAEAARQRENQAHPLWHAYEAVRRIADDLALRSLNPAAAARDGACPREVAEEAQRLEDMLRRQLPHPETSTPDIQHSHWREEVKA